MSKNQYKILGFIFILVLAALACIRPVETSTESEAISTPTNDQLDQILDQIASQEPPEIEATNLAQALIVIEGATLVYSPEVFGQLTPQIVEAALEGAYQYPSPRHAEFSTPFGNGVLSMVPVHSYELVYDEAPGLIADLQRDIDAPPQVGLDCISQLPLRAFFHHCTHQEFTASPARLVFANGVGVRFVTVYAIQDLAPVDNQNLRYVFQGVTDDEQCYVTAEFEITNDSLPEEGEIPQDVYTSLDGVAADEYFGGLAEQITANPYSPELAQLDAFISSLEVIQCGVDQ